jgi:hypothetical protein
MDLEQISKQYNVSIDELTKVEATLRKQYSSVANIVSPEQVEMYITKGIEKHCNRFKNLGLNQYFGVILNVSQPRDGITKKRSTAIKAYIENPDAAVTLGMVEEYKDGMKRSLVKGMVKTVPCNKESIPKIAVYLPDQKSYVIPLDHRESWASGKKNFAYLKPLPTEQYFINIGGIASSDGTIWKPFKMMFNCNEHVNTPNITIPQSKLVKFYAKPKNDGEILELNYNNTYTKFEFIDGDISQLNAEVMNVGVITPLSDIQSVYDARKTNFDVISVFGSIMNKWKKESTDENPHPWMTAFINDNTTENPVKMLIHPDMSAEFEENNLVKAWGSLSLGKKWDPEMKQSTDEEEFTLFVTGVYSFSTNEVLAKEEIVDDGWEE